MFPWYCPCKKAGSLPCPQPDVKGSRLYVHITDRQGYNLELWCDAYPTSGYEINISYPDGTIENVSNCIYWFGQNLVEITYNGNLDSLLLPTGAKGYYVDSLIQLFHHNFVGNRDTIGFFLNYKYYVDSVIRLKYESKKDANGVSRRTVEDLEETTLSYNSGDSLSGDPGHYVSLDPDAPKDTICGYINHPYPVDFRPQQVFIRSGKGKPFTAAVYYLEPQHLYDFSFDKKILTFQFDGGVPNSFINLAIPVTLWDKPVKYLTAEFKNKKAAAVSVKYTAQYYIITVHSKPAKGKIKIYPGQK